MCQRHERAVCKDGREKQKSTQIRRRSEKISVDAERQRRYRAVRKLRVEPTCKFLEEIAEMTGLPLEEVQELAKKDIVSFLYLKRESLGYFYVMLKGRKYEKIFFVRLIQ